jgi:hypothetical protein
MRGLEYSLLVSAIPPEITGFDIQERNGELTARVGAAELRAAVDFLIAKGLADSRLKAALRRQADVRSR